MVHVIVDDLAETEGQIGEDVRCGDDLAHRQIGDRRQSMGPQIERRRSGPGAFHGDVFEPVVDKLKNPRAAVDMRNDLQEVVRLSERSGNGLQSAALCLYPIVPVATRTVP